MTDTFIPLSVPNIKGNEAKYALSALEQGWVSSGGEYVSQLEDEVAEYLGAPGAVACQSGTAALHIALLLAGVEAGDAVIVPSLTFIAAVNPVRYVGADPVFMDCDDSLCMDPEKLERYLANECVFEDGVLKSRGSGGRIAAMVVVHVFGNMADMVRIMEIADRYNIPVIEDATEALGTRYTGGAFDGSSAGCIGDVGAFSFNGNKIITTGGGGMLVAKDPEALQHAKHLTTQAKSDPVRYEHDEVGYNYRMTNVQAAIGVGQMEQLSGFVATKNKNYDHYNERLVAHGLEPLLPFREGTQSNKWFYSFIVPDGVDRDALMDYLLDHGVQTRPIWGLIHEQKPYEGSETYNVTEAVKYRDRVLNLPCSTDLSFEGIDQVVSLLVEGLAHLQTDE